MMKESMHIHHFWGNRRSAMFWLVAVLIIESAAVRADAQENRTISPHGAIKIACNNCHTTVSWKPIRPFPDFNHQNTRFLLQGMHAKADCRQCHIQLVFSSAGNACSDCHADIHRRQLGANCAQCHTVRGWRIVSVSVNGHENRFPLLGFHKTLQCESCHKSAAVSQFRGLDSECNSCHLSDFRAAKTIDHQAAKFSTKCDSCHSTDSWIRGFDHARFAGFTLIGAHAQLNCQQCHVGGRFVGTPANCVGCHLQKFNQTINPNHIVSNFPQDCSLCHSMTSWIPASFNHNTARFPLTGVHAKQQCLACHNSGQYATLPTTCVSCHLANYNGTTNPKHTSAGFPQDCSICHSTTAWTPAPFNHNATRFPLTGAHAQQQCLVCHSSGQYATLPTTCVSCHLANYNATANPKHTSASFPQDCTVCHNTTAWTPAAFDHSKTKYPLTGAHRSVACANCHISGVYVGTPSDCYSCHSKEYNSVTNPSHVSAGFPRDCSQCHSTSAWSGAAFAHARFPIYSGTHAGKWTTCGDCHANPNNYSVFSCLTCHAHDKSTTDANHRGVSNYVYNSANCYTCHSNGRAD
jgi:hypothetical protein